MNYEKIYNDLIQKRREFPLVKEGNGQVEEHHIIPKSFGGTNDEHNLINLSLKEHFFAHLLLMHIHRSDRVKYAKMCASVYCMIAKGMVLSSRLYSILKQGGNVWVGKHHTLSQRDKVRNTMTPKNSSNDRVWVCKEGVVKYVLKTKLNTFLDDGWEKGRVGYKPRKGHQGKIIQCQVVS